MRLTFRCMDAGAKMVNMQNPKTGQVEEKLIYYTTFHKLPEQDLRFLGQLPLESLDPLHYKVGKKYTIDISEFSEILPVTNLKMIPKPTRNN